MTVDELVQVVKPMRWKFDTGSFTTKIGPFYRVMMSRDSMNCRFLLVTHESVVGTKVLFEIKAQNHEDHIDSLLGDLWDHVYNKTLRTKQIKADSHDQLMFADYIEGQIEG